MKHILEQLFAHQTLSYDQSKETMIRIGEGGFPPAQVSAFLAVFRMRSITLNEISGFRDALRELSLKVDLSEFNPTDLCGTGGDGKDTFNISTLASFVVAGAGIPVAKHGNYGVSSSCGSSNVIQHLGLRFTDDASKLKRQIDQAGICFLHAPLFHPAMSRVAPIRKELGFKTFFNMLGPLVNPSAPGRQLVGVFSLELARMYQHLFELEQENRSGEYVILHALDGYDEMSLTGTCKVVTPRGVQMVDPEQLGLPRLQPGELHGGKTVPQAAEIFTSILQGDGTSAQNHAVCANAALAIQCARPGINFQDALGTARESLQSGAALNSLKKLLAA